MDEYVSQKEFDKLKKSIMVHQKYINFIHVFYELEPKEFLKDLFDLSHELIGFSDNVCVENDLNYWLDGETLRTAVMHDDFNLWNGNFTLGMMREDYDELTNILHSQTNPENVCFNHSRILEIRFAPQQFKKALFLITVHPYDYSNIPDKGVYIASDAENTGDNSVIHDFKSVFPLKKIRFGKTNTKLMGP